MRIGNGIPISTSWSGFPQMYFNGSVFGMSYETQYDFGIGIGRLYYFSVATFSTDLVTWTPATLINEREDRTVQPEEYDPYLGYADGLWYCFFTRYGLDMPSYVTTSNYLNWSNPVDLVSLAGLPDGSNGFPHFATDGTKCFTSLSVRLYRLLRSRYLPNSVLWGKYQCHWDHPWSLRPPC
jgi:hypothetical protein